MYYRGAGAAVVVYDITNKVSFASWFRFTAIAPVQLLNNFQESFDGAKSWITELQRRGDKNCIIALAGNKSDMNDEREVETDVCARLHAGVSKNVKGELTNVLCRKLWSMHKKWEYSSKRFRPKQVIMWMSCSLISVCIASEILSMLPSFIWCILLYVLFAARKLPLHEPRDDDVLDVTSNEKSQKKCC